MSGKPAAEQFGGLPTHCKDPLGFTWWLVTHVAMLGQYSRSGTLQYEVRGTESFISHDDVGAYASSCWDCFYFFEVSCFGILISRDSYCRCRSILVAPL